MAAIEKITANEKVVTVRKPDGTKQTIVVRVWNETVANLTLMALGTSAPEILLSIIEIFSNNFQAGDLGPGNRFSLKYSHFVEHMRLFIISKTLLRKKVQLSEVLHSTCSQSLQFAQCASQNMKFVELNICVYFL